MSLPTSLDRFDRAILEALQRDNQTPQRVIADMIGLSAPAVQRRIRRLERDGVIIANTAVVHPDAVGQAVTLIVEVELITETAAALDAAKAAFRACPQVQQCYYVTGEADFVLVITAAGMADYEALTRRLFFADANVKRFRTLVAMDRVKVGLSLPISPAPSQA